MYLTLIALLLCYITDAHAANMMHAPQHPLTKTTTHFSTQTDEDRQNIALTSIHFFQHHISTMDGDRCQFSPTCSTYGYQAIQQQGTVQGIIMIADRLMRCSYLTDKQLYKQLPNHSLCDSLADNLLDNQ